MKPINRKRFHILVLLIAAVSLTACDKTSNETTTNAKTIETPNKTVENKEISASDLISQAKEQLKKASAARFEWNTTAPLISQAEDAIKSGDIKQAKEFAERAIKEANNSLKQAQYADEHWQDHAIN